MAEVVEEINRAFEKNPEIDELGMVLSSDESIVLVEHKLGISMAILKPLFKYSITELQKHRSVLLKPIDSISVAEAKLICDLSRAILLVKGDFPPALNARKTMISNGILSASGEVQFLNVIFSKHPKSPSAWHHRRWCLQRLFLCSNISTSTSTSSSTSTPEGDKEWSRDREGGDQSGRYSFSSVVAEEVALCERMCDLYPRNYYSWNHRLWLAQQMNDLRQVSLDIAEKPTTIQQQLTTIRIRIRKRISNFSDNEKSFIASSSGLFACCHMIKCSFILIYFPCSLCIA